jgi:AcrR family transcriptional regulator
MDDTRQNLINCAGAIFSAKGFETTTVREVCQAAGVNIAAIHYHFGDKERLYIECVKHAHCRHGMTEFEWPGGMSSQDRLTSMVVHMLTMMLATDQPVWQIELMVRELARPTAACRALVEEFISPVFTQLLGIVSEMLPAEAPLLTRQQTAFSVVAQCLLYRYHRPIGQLLIGEEQFQRLLNVDTVAHQIVAFSLGGIRECARQFEVSAAEEAGS